mmetsp:Transcript_30535/g.59593  ORF Transcript_30535/g.59593 Transcript_30535/m.59593 type:complete len:187 (+) Transcript_30535:34-594(+)
MKEDQRVTSTWHLTQELNGREEFKTIYKDDRIALSVVSALIMTVAFGALLIAPDETKLKTSGAYTHAVYVYVLANTISGCASMLGLWVGSYQYLVMNKTPVNKALAVADALGDGWGPLDSPMFWTLVSLISLLVALGASVFMIHEMTIFGMSLTIIVLCFILMFALQQKFRRVWKNIVATSTSDSE